MRTDADQAAVIVNPGGGAPVVLVCEHASSMIPASLAHLGLTPDTRTSHAAWDPGALGVAVALSDQLDASLVAGTVSRLVHDLNRPSDAPDAMPARSELIDVPGNAALSDADRDLRVRTYYAPFHATLADRIACVADPVIVTIHSFTPVFHGAHRTTEIGVLHDTDTRLADAMLDHAAAHTSARVARNDPYGPADGVTHTLQRHGVAHGHPNVMLEIRNDLIATEDAQRAMANVLAGWLTDAIAALPGAGGLSCSA